MTDDYDDDIDPEMCGWCGRTPALGFATIDGIRYCHETAEEAEILQAIREGTASAEAAAQLRAMIETLEPTCYEEFQEYDAADTDWRAHYMTNANVNPRYL